MKRSRLSWLAAAVFGLVSLPYVLPVFDHATMAAYGDLYADLPLITLIFLLPLFRVRPEEPPAARRFWTLLGTGMGAWWLARIFYLTWPGESLTIDLTTDFVTFLLYLVLLVALESPPDTPDEMPLARTIRRYTLAGGIVMFLACFGYFGIIPGLVDAASFRSWMPSTIGFVFFDGYVAVRLAILWRRSGDGFWRRNYALLALGFSLWTCTDFLQILQILVDIPWLVVGTPVDLLWYLPYAPVLAAIICGHRGDRTRPNAEAWTAGQEAGSYHPGNISLLVYAFLLPTLHLGLYAIGEFEPLSRTPREFLLFGETLVLAGLVIRVNHLVFRENRRLMVKIQGFAAATSRTNRLLESRVKQRTAELEKLNVQLAEDIRRRIFAEDQWRSSESRTKALIKAIPDSLYLLDRNGRVLEALPAKNAPELPGAADIAFGRFVEILPPEHALDFALALESMWSTGDEQTLELAVERNGTTIHLDLRLAPCGTDEVLVVMQDVTRRRQAESAMHHTQKLESLGVLAGGIAHDFNNLLVSILGQSQLAKAALDDPAGVKGSLDIIETSARRAGRLTDNLLAYAGRSHLESAPFDLAAMVTEMTPLLQASIPKKAQLEVDVSAADLWTDGNDSQTAQIVLNLVVNAADALDGGVGTIRLELSDADVSSPSEIPVLLGEHLPPGRYVRLRVSDDGCGIDEKTQASIFDPFFTTKAHGRGLGLAAVMGIVARHRGYVGLDSNVGAGTVFTVFFPAMARPETVPAATARAIHNARGSGAILVADDEEDIRDLLDAVLSKHGFETLLVASGEEAVARFEAEAARISAVILDLSMPEMSGAEACQVIREARPDVPVILMSGYTQDESLADLRGRKGIHFLHKPFDLDVVDHLLFVELSLTDKQAAAEG